MIKWIRHNKNHLIAWSIFMAYESVILGLYSGEFGKFWNYAVHYAINIALFYAHAHFVLYKALNQKNKAYWRIPLFIGIEIFLYITVLFIVDTLLLHYTDFLSVNKVDLNKQYYFRSIFRGSYFIGFSTGYYFLITFLTERKRAEELEKIRLNNIINAQKIEQELAKSQNAYLRAQINPHFLFNTLDFIYHNARKNSPLAAEAIVTLSDMMRYAINTTYTGDCISLGDEIEQVENLIHLYQLKANSNLFIDLKYSEEVKTMPFIPLVLITLAENIFKHGNLTIESHSASINVFIQNNNLHIETDNLVKEARNTKGLNSGLVNIAKRLDHSYGKNSNFNFCIDEHAHFKAFLSVKLIH